jgi:hypothetical protein
VLFGDSHFARGPYCTSRLGTSQSSVSITGQKAKLTALENTQQIHFDQADVFCNQPIHTSDELYLVANYHVDVGEVFNCMCGVPEQEGKIRLQYQLRRPLSQSGGRPLCEATSQYNIGEERDFICAVRFGRCAATTYSKTCLHKGKVLKTTVITLESYDQDIFCGIVLRDSPVTILSYPICRKFCARATPLVS